ncbi:MAG: PspC domain-containing protein [Bacteroidota bacterium]
MERKLHRIEGGNSVVGGVAAGLAEYFAIDVAIIRVIFVLGFFTPIPSIIAYIILWIVLPRQFGSNSNVVLNDSSNNLNPVSTMKNSKSSGGQIGGIVLVALGSIFLADEFIPWFDFDKLWPLVLIAIGVWILTKDKKKDSDPSEDAPTTTTDSSSESVDNNL